MIIPNIRFGVVVKTIVGILLIVAGVAIRPIMYLATAYAFVVILLEKEPINILCMMFAWLNVSTIFKFSVEGMSMFTLLELVMIAKLILRKKRIEGRFLLLWFVYLVYLIIGMGSAYTDLVKAICIPLIIYLISRNIKYEDLGIISFYYIFGVFANSIVGLMRSSIPNMTLFVIFKQQGYGYAAQSLILTDRFSGLWGDPNYYSIHLIVCIAIISVLFSRKEINGIGFYGIYISMILFGAMTGSKSFIFMLVFVTVFTILLLIKEKQYSHSVFFIAVIAVGVVLLVSGYIDVFSKVLYRMQNLTNSGMSTGRTEIWKSYYDLYNDNLSLLMFGSGLGQGFLLRVPHNSFLDVFALFGVAGAVLVFSTFFVSIKQNSEIRKTESIIPLLTLGILYFFLSMFYSVEMPFRIALAAAFLYLTPIRYDSQIME